MARETEVDRMRRSQQTEAMRKVIRTKLEAGETVDADEVLRLSGVDIPAKVAFVMWRNGVVRNLAHRVGDELGIDVLSVGGGKVKAVETRQEAELAQRRAGKQLVGHARRRREMRKHPAALDPNQQRFPLEGVANDAGADSAQRTSIKQA